MARYWELATQYNSWVEWEKSLEKEVNNEDIKVE